MTASQVPPGPGEVICHLKKTQGPISKFRPYRFSKVESPVVTC